MRIDTSVTPELEEDLLAKQPWMHAYRLADNVVVGRFKGTVSDETTACVSSSSKELTDAMVAAFERHMASDPAYEVRELVSRVGAEGRFLDIACATGWHSLTLADLGVEDVTGVEIRAEQVEQAELIRSLAHERFHGVRFEHEPTSADDPSFRAGESYDVVVSLGLMYHLSDPFTYVANLRRLTHRAALINTLTHAQERGFWLHVREDAAWMSKAWTGVSWIPHFADVPDLLRAAGFSRVEEITRPAFKRPHQRDARTKNRAARLLLPGAYYTMRGLIDARSVRRERLGVTARYYTYLAYR